MATLPEERTQPRRQSAAREHATPDGRRQRFADLLQARVHIFGDTENFLRPGSDLLAHPLETTSSHLEVRDTDCVLIAHPQGDVSRRLAGQPPIFRVVVQFADRSDAVQIEISIKIGKASCRAKVCKYV